MLGTRHKLTLKQKRSLILGPYKRDLTPFQFHLSRYLSATQSLSAVASAMAVAAADSSTSPAPSSPSVLSPRMQTGPVAAAAFSWPVPVWQCFLVGASVKFLIPSLETPWQSPEELAAKDAKALEIDPRNEFKYAPNGLTIVKVS